MLLNPLPNPAPGFDASRVTIERHRNSTTQGEVTVTYDGVLIGRFGDTILLDEEGKWTGHKDSFWIGVAEKEVSRRKLLGPATSVNEVFGRVMPTSDQVKNERERVSCGVVEARKTLVFDALHALMLRPEPPTNVELAAAIVVLLGRANV